MTFEQAIKQAIIQYLEGHNLDEYTKVVGSKKRKYNKSFFSEIEMRVEKGETGNGY